MGISLRASALVLVIMACDGQRFETGAPAAGGRGGGGSDPGAGAGAQPEGTTAGEGGATIEDPSGTSGQAGELNAAHGGEGGASEPICAVACPENEECAATPSGPECRCGGGLVREGEACRLPRSCDELHGYTPSAPSGAYTLEPEGAGTSFRAHCGMVQEGGGWTLTVNEGPSFDPTTNGVADEVCYGSSCTNLAYSLVPIRSDVMLDVSNSPIATTTYAARLIVSGLHANSRGKTLRTLFTTGPNYVEAENNQNLAVRMRDGAECESLPVDLAKIACTSCDTEGCKVPIIVFGDGDGAASCREGGVPRLAIGAATDYTTAWSNCAGWPQDPNFAGTDFYPDYVRVWVR